MTAVPLLLALLSLPDQYPGLPPCAVCLSRYHKADELQAELWDQWQRLDRMANQKTDYNGGTILFLNRDRMPRLAKAAECEYREAYALASFWRHACLLRGHAFATDDWYYWAGELDREMLAAKCREYLGLAWDLPGWWR